VGQRIAKVSGPLGSDGRGWIFGQPDLDVAANELVMEEYLLSGEATSYDLADGATPGIDGLWDVEPTSSAPYRTRLYVVRPSTPAAFNGTVLVNWQNVTIGVDFGMPDLGQLGRGFAWVGVTTQRVAVEGQPELTPEMPATLGLRDWDPERYGSLDHPGDQYSYDIFSQAARLLRDDPSIVLGGLRPRLLIATGGSQSAMRLGSYINIAHQFDRVIDGFLLTVHWGLCPPPPDMGLVESFELTPEFRFKASAQIRDDANTPIVVVNSESETGMVSMVRQPDTDTFRFWELAGTAHGGGQASDDMTAVLRRDGVSDGLPPVATRNTVNWDYVADAALERLIEWIDTGRAPVSIPPIELAPGTPDGIKRDEVGNALGGVRLPEVVAPLAVHSGTNSLGPASALLGETRPLPAEEVKARYVDLASFLKTWDAAVDDLSALGLVLPATVQMVKDRGRALAAPAFGLG
jgi:hypothetical protein